ncbi:hypothetical protein BJ165DRAFT_896597 [Panaeolus papilionaceus]|nr:hypothetical protein BJ165DRAFT_896597 [Panaeolus papilionaceus]
MTVTAKSRLHLFLALLHQQLPRILKPHLIGRALTAILRRLATIWGFLRRKIFPDRKKGLDHGPPKGFGDLPESSINSETTSTSETSISLEGVACSSLPGPDIPRLTKDSKKSLRNLAHSRQHHVDHVVANSPYGSRNNSCTSHIYDMNQPQAQHEETAEEYTIGVESPRNASNPDLGIDTEVCDSPTGHRPSSPAQLSHVDTHSHLSLPHYAQSTHSFGSQGETESLLQRDIIPISPEHHKRYLNREKVSFKITSRTIPPLTLSYATERSLRGGWTVHVHTEGARYFYNAAKRLYTDADLFNPEIRRHVEGIYTRIQKDIKPDWRFPSNYDLVLDITEQDGQFETNYYYVDHTSRVAFWLDEFCVEDFDVWLQVIGVTSLSHIGRESEAQYWHHCQIYPTSFVLTRELVRELRDIILQNIGDATTSPYSTSPYELDELHKMLSLMTNIEANVGDDPLNIGTRNLVARFFWVFTRERFIHFYGEPSARLDRTQTVYAYGPAVGDRTLLIKTVSPFLFLAPEVTLRTLQKMFVDGLVNKPLFERSMKKLNDEWQEIIIFATVLLNANVAFLAIQSVDVGKPSRSPIQISCYLSVVASVGCIILSLLLIRQTRNKTRECAAEASEFLYRRSSVAFGVESLAIMYSLPYAFLMWAMTSFLSAFCFLCFLKTSIVTRAIITPPGLVLLVFVGWCLWIYWEKKKENQDSTDKPLVDVRSKGATNQNEDVPDEGRSVSGQTIDKEVTTESPESESVSSHALPHRSLWPSLPRLPVVKFEFPWGRFKRRRNSDSTLCELQPVSQV